MKAIVYHRYGSPDVLELAEVDRPAVGDDQVLVRVHASSVNALDWHYMRGKPYIARPSFGLLKPKDGVLGADFAGTVDSVGRNVREIQPGDEVFGGKFGSLAEYVCVSESGAVVPKPANLTFEQAAAVPVAASTALQGLRDRGQVQSARSEGPGQWRRGRCGHLHRADCKVTRSRGDCRHQHEERGEDSVDRC